MKGRKGRLSAARTAMNDIIRSLHERKSVRAYLDQPIPPEDRRAILEAACQAPTAGNQQLYTILDITDPELKKALSVTCDNQPFIAAAPMVLVFCADCKKWYDAYREAGCQPRLPGVGDLMLAVTDTAIAAQNAVTAAESLGLGSCYIGDIMENCQEQRRLLSLPEYVFPAVMVVLGYPTQTQRQRPKPQRCALEHIVHEKLGDLRRRGCGSVHRAHVQGSRVRCGIHSISKRGDTARLPLQKRCEPGGGEAQSLRLYNEGEEGLQAVVREES